MVIWELGKKGKVERKSMISVSNLSNRGDGGIVD